MTLKIHFTFICALWVINSHAQTNSLSMGCNAPREGDSLVKIQIPYIDPTTKGVGCVWHYNTQVPDTKDYVVTYSTHGDSIINIEHETIYYNKLCNDSVIGIGFENRTSKIHYIQPIFEQKYPFQLGDSINSIYCGKGKYGAKLNVGIWGRNCVIADGTGVLVNGTDTIHNVLRVHKRYEFIRQTTNVPFPDDLFCASNVQLMLQSHNQVIEDHYLWYVEGWRYPVMESIDCQIRDSLGNMSSMFQTSFLYLPEWQDMDVSFDYENEMIKRDANNHNINKLLQDDNVPLITDVAAELLDGGRQLKVCYGLASNGILKIIACDAFGRPLGISSYERTTGVHEEIISFTNVPVNNTVVLYFEINNYKYSRKFTLSR